MDNGGNVELSSGKVAILGFGSQGHAHALNLHESGVHVMVGLRLGSASPRRGRVGRASRSAPLPRRSQAAQLVVVLLPDQVAEARLRRTGRAQSRRRRHASFSRTASTREDGRVKAPAGHDVIMVAPKGPGHVVRRLFTEGLGTPAVVAVAQDASGQALELALAYVDGNRRRARRHAPDDLRGGDRDGPLRRAGGALRRRGGVHPAGFDTLVDAGYQPEVAYYECLHELKLIVDLI